MQPRVVYLSVDQEFTSPPQRRKQQGNIKEVEKKMVELLISPESTPTACRRAKNSSDKEPHKKKKPRRGHSLKKEEGSDEDHDR